MSSAKEEEILDAVENGMYRFALQQCQKLIKKSPNSTYYQVLNNYILLESGKSDEALKNCLEIMTKTPNDTKSLFLLNKIFLNLGKEKESQQIFENAARKYPSFELLTNWFHFGCETGDYRILQKSSISLKNFRSNQRLFNLWAAFNSYLGTINEDSTKIEQTLFPKLGLKLIDDLKPLKTEQEVFVLVKLLELNNDYNRIIDEIIEFTENDKLDLELQIILLDSLNKVENWEKLFEFSKLILIDYKLDDFNTWKYLIKSGLKLSKNDEILNIINNYNNTRNSQLALIEFNLQSGSKADDSIKNYLTKFGSKNSTFLDLKNYLKLIDSNGLLTWLNDQPIPENERGLSWIVNLTKLKVFLDNDLLLNEDFVIENIKNFNKFNHLIKKKIKTDFFQGDELLLFIINSLLIKDFSVKNIILSIIILENAILNDYHEFHLRLWLIQLYTLINCHSQAKVHYEVLKIKQIQHDIFDHYLVSRISSISPNYNEFLNDLISNYDRIEAENVYFLKVGYNKASFNKLKGILEFQERIDKSSLKNHIILQSLKIGKLTNDKLIISKNERLLKEINLKNQFDNRDFKIFWDIGINEELRFKSNILSNIPTNLSEYNKIQLFLESLTNGSSIDIKNEFNLSTLTDIEKWSFDLILKVVEFLNNHETDLDQIKKLYKFPNIPKELNWEVNHDIITIIDTTKSIQSLISNSLKTTKKRSVINDLKEVNIELLQKIREDLILDKKQELNKNINEVEIEINLNSILKDLNINQTTIKRIFEIIRNSNDESFKLLRIL